MSNHTSSVSYIICLLVALLLAAPGSLAAKTFKLDCTKKSELQKTIDAAVDGDLIEITGICMENILIEDKALRLVGAPTPGPHGITGVTEGNPSVRIINSRGTLLEGLQVHNPLYTGVLITDHSDVTMRDCEVSNAKAGQASGIWVQETSKFGGIRLRLENNLRGLAAYRRSEAICEECDLINNTYVATTAWKSSTVGIIDSLVTGQRGVHADENSYMDMVCEVSGSDHPCGLNVTGIAAVARWRSEVTIADVGDFSGWLRARYGSKVWLYGARQVDNPNFNEIHDNSMLRVDPGSTGDSLLSGHTVVQGFSNAQIYGTGTELSGSLLCESGGDAWVEPGIDLSGVVVHGACEHMPTP